MKSIYHIFICSLLGLSLSGFAQNYADKNHYLIDSLDLSELSKGDVELLEHALKEYHAASADTAKIYALDAICENLVSDVWKDYQYYQLKLIESYQSSHPLASSKLINIHSSALNNIGLAKMDEGELSVALGYFRRALDVQSEAQNLRSISDIFHNIGNLYGYMADVQNSLKYHSKALKIREEIDDKLGIAKSLSALAFHYGEQGDTDKAIEYLKKVLKIRKEFGDLIGLASDLSNISYLHYQKKEYEKSLHYALQSLEMSEQIGDKQGMATIYNNIGGYYMEMGNLDEALNHYGKALELRNQLGKKSHISISLHMIGRVKMMQKMLDKALYYAHRSDEIAHEINYPENIRESSQLLYEIYEQKGDGKLALKHYKKYIEMRDSINNSNNQKAAIRQQTQYEFEKAQIIKENEAKEARRLEQEERSRRDNLQYSLIFLGILLLFGVVLSLGFIKVSPNIAEGIIFFAFLILFEFILVFTDPYLEQLTHEEPMYNLLANSVIALFIFPLHAVLEKLLKKRIVK